MATFFLRQGKEIPSRSAFLHLRKLLAEFSFKENALPSLRLIGVVIIVVAAADGLGGSVSHERASLHFDLESRELLLLGLSGRARMPNPRSLSFSFAVAIFVPIHALKRTRTPTEYAAINS